MNFGLALLRNQSKSPFWTRVLIIQNSNSRRKLRRSLWLIILGSVLLGNATMAGQQSAQDLMLSNWQRHCLWRVDQLSKFDGLTFDQAFIVKRYLEEQRSNIELFDKYGLLDEQGKLAKRREIQEVTALNIEALLLPGQWERWREWERQFFSRKAI